MTRRHAAPAAFLLLAALPLTLWADAPASPPANAPAATPPAATAPVGPAVTLRYHFAPGQVHRYRMTMDMDGGMQMGGANPRTIPLQTHMVMVLRQTVQTVRASDGAATVASAVESVSGTANGQPLPPAVLAQAQKTLSAVVMTPTGQVLSMQMPQGSPMAGMSIGNFSQAGVILPHGPVHVGDTWKGTTTLGGQTAAAVGMTSTLTDLATTPTSSVATVAQVMNGTLNFAPANTPVPLSIHGTITGTGTLHFDTAAGVVNSQTNVMQIAMTVTPPDPANGTAPTIPPMQMRMHLTMDMERLPDVAASPAP